MKSAGLLIHQEQINQRVEGSVAPGQADTLEAQLQQSIDTNNIALARTQLKKRANPHSMILAKASDAMYELVTYARRFDKIYQYLPISQETKLDQSLRAVLRGKLSIQDAKQDAIKLLKEKTQERTFNEESISRVWADAVNSNQVDVQRAVLLLYPNLSLKFRLGETSQVQDEQVRQVMKENPYLPPNNELDYLNGAATFSNGAPIVCRHLVAYLLLRQLRDLQGKFYAKNQVNPFASKESIGEHVTIRTDKCLNLAGSARESHLFYNTRLGQKLIAQFEAMETQKEPVRLMMLLSTEHAMSIRLRIKTRVMLTDMWWSFLTPM